MTALSPGEVRRRLRYEPDTGRLYWRIGTARAGKGAEAGCLARRSVGAYLVIGINGKIYLAHRLAWVIVTGRWPENEIDHIDHDGTNNRWSNLRLVEHRSNQRNQRLRSSNTSGANGVSRRKSGRWSAYIKVDGRKKSLGTFDTVEEAAAARRSADERYGYHVNHGA